MSRYPRHSLVASRGCRFDCIFCDRGSAESRKMRDLSLERVVDWAARLVRDLVSLSIRILDSTSRSISAGPRRSANSSSSESCAFAGTANHGWTA